MPRGAESLGTTTEFHSPLPSERSAREVAEALDWGTGELVYSDESRRLRRWEMQKAARTLLPDSRVVGCHRYRIKSGDLVRVYRRQNSATYYGGLQVCGMVWACPVCAAKIAEKRRADLVLAMTRHEAAGGSVLLMTLTVPHSREDEPFALLARLLKAYTAFGGGKRAWKSLLPAVRGSVRALEVTHGAANGWHPHLHVLVFLDDQVDAAKWTPVLLDQWAKVVKRHKLGEVNEHGLRLDDGSKAAKYASKWGLEDEMTKAHIKQGRKGGSRTPFALLADYAEGDQHAGHLFREFVGVFKGKSQLQWSRGLRDHFELDVDKTDEDLALEKVDALDILVARIGIEDWKLILRHELRGQVLELLRTAGWEALELLLSNYRARGAAPGMVATTVPDECRRRERGGDVLGQGTEMLSEWDGTAAASSHRRESNECGTHDDQSRNEDPTRDTGLSSARPARATRKGKR